MVDTKISYNSDNFLSLVIFLLVTITSSLIFIEILLSIVSLLWAQIKLLILDVVINNIICYNIKLYLEQFCHKSHIYVNKILSYKQIKNLILYKINKY